MGGVDKSLSLKKDRATNMNLAAEKHSLKLNSPGATALVPMLLVTATSSDEN